MKQFVILADATCDLGEDFQEKYDIRVIPGHITLPDKTEVPSILKWEKYSREQFYAELKKNPTASAKDVSASLSLAHTPT